MPRIRKDLPYKMAMLAEELWTHTHTSGEPVNHRLGGVRKCRGLFEVKLSWHGVHTSRHNRVSLSRPIIPTSNKWRATSWRVLVALILFILPFTRTFLLHLMVVLSSVVLSLRIQTHSHIPHLDGDQIEILGIGLGGKHLIYSLTPCMWNFLNAKNVNFSLSNQIAVTYQNPDWQRCVLLHAVSIHQRHVYRYLYYFTIGPRTCSWCEIVIKTKISR